MQTQTSKLLALLLIGAGFLASCAQETDNQEPEVEKLTEANATLQAQIAALEAQVAELKTTPAMLLAEVDAAVKKEDLDLAKQHLATLQTKYPQSTEAGTGVKLVEALDAKRKAAEREAARMAALGLKALKVNNVFEHEGLKLNVTSAAIANAWSFDSYGDSYHYREAERGSKYVTARVSVTSKDKDPNLFGIGAYVEENGKLALRGKLEYRFARWMDYGTYLGNESDFRNDFAHTATIPFSAATEISNDKLKRPVYLVATKQKCHSRSYQRFDNPPVSYFGDCSGMRQILSVEDFKNGDYAVLKRIN